MEAEENCLLSFLEKEEKCVSGFLGRHKTACIENQV